MTDALLADLIAYVGAADPEVSVILRHNGGQRGKRLLDVIKASPYPIVQCDAIKSAKDKSSLVVADVRRAGRSIAPEAVGALVDALGSDVRELCSAVDQLLADTQGTISVDHVRTYYAGLFAAAPAADETDDIVNTLIALGYNEREAKAAIKGIPKGTEVGEGVRLALKNLLK